ncbi:MAG: hypothetical protein M0Z59_06395 [Nitrospiraceae bacterium]|nr:hypothetical protein [Nitrospiraceae bacterium]
MANRKLLEYIASLSDEEREKYSALIGDALERGEESSRAFNELRKALAEYEADLIRLKEEAARLEDGLARLNEKLAGIDEAAEALSKMAGSGPVWN